MAKRHITAPPVNASSKKENQYEAGNVYTAVCEYALDEERRAQSRLYNFMLINTLLFLAFNPLASNCNIPGWIQISWSIVACLLNLFWCYIGYRIIVARKFWNGLLRRIEEEYVNTPALRVFQERDRFHGGCEVEIVDQCGRHTIKYNPFLRGVRTTVIESGILPTLFLIVWIAMTLLKCFKCI